MCIISVRKVSLFKRKRKTSFQWKWNTRVRRELLKKKKKILNHIKLSKQSLHKGKRNDKYMKIKNANRYQRKRNCQKFILHE